MNMANKKEIILEIEERISAYILGERSAYGLTKEMYSGAILALRNLLNWINNRGRIIYIKG